MKEKTKDTVLKEIAENESFWNESDFLQWYDSLEDAPDYIDGLKDAKKEVLKYEIFDSIFASEKKKIAFSFFRSKKLSGIAATVAIFFATFGMYNYWNKNEPNVYQSTYGQMKHIQLEDGSTVTLNGNSTLRFINRADEREAWLNGEASFDVVHEENDKRFIVHLSDTTSIEVLGTQFNVSNRPKESQIVLKNGKVKVDFATKDKTFDYTYMTPGDLVSFKSEKAGYKKEQVTNVDQYFSWQKSILLLEETSLEVMVDMLRNTYGIELLVNNESLNSRKASGSFPLRADRNKLLKNVTALYDVILVKDNGYLLLKDQ